MEEDFQEIRKLTDKLKRDAKNLSSDEFDRRQKEILDKLSEGCRKIRHDLMNGWLEPDGTFHRILEVDEHELWSLRELGVRARVLMYRGWVKVTQWDKERGTKDCIGMYCRELTPDQEFELKKMNARPYQVSMNEK